MAIRKETGAIVANSNTYADIAQAELYHEDQGNTTWAGFTEEVQEAGLIRGTLMMESRYRNRWIGWKTNNNQGVVQSLAWPRKLNDDQPTQDDVTVDDDPQALLDADKIPIGINSIPIEVQQACMEAAFMHASNSPLVPNVVGQDRYIQKVKVDVIERSFRSEVPAVDRFPLIDQLLQSLAAVGGVNLTMVIGLAQAEVDSINNQDATSDYLRSLSGA